MILMQKFCMLSFVFVDTYRIVIQVLLLISELVNIYLKFIALHKNWLTACVFLVTFVFKKKAVCLSEGLIRRCFDIWRNEEDLG